MKANCRKPWKVTERDAARWWEAGWDMASALDVYFYLNYTMVRRAAAHRRWMKTLTEKELRKVLFDVVCEHESDGQGDRNDN